MTKKEVLIMAENIVINRVRHSEQPVTARKLHEQGTIVNGYDVNAIIWNLVGKGLLEFTSDRRLILPKTEEFIE